MRVILSLFGSILALFLTLNAYAQSDPPCLPQASVPEMADNPQHGWLSKEGVDAVKAHFEKK